MKILLIGASGTVGSAIKAELAQRHEVISIGRSSGDFQVDISDSASIRKLFEQTGKFDALVCAAGSVNFVPLGDMSETDFELGLRDKLMGQVNLLLIGREYANDGASFTFTSGILNRDPIRTGASAGAGGGDAAGERRACVFRAGVFHHHPGGAGDRGTPERISECLVA